MQLAGPGIFGPPRDRDEAVRVLRTVVELGLTHIDTSDFYGPYVVNELIREALHPYPQDLRIVTKVGGRRGNDASWLPAMSPGELVSAVHDNLDHLGVDALDVVNLRMMEDHDGFVAPSIEQGMTVLADLQAQGLIRHLGVSTVDADQLARAQAVAPVVCVQNHYNVAHRVDDALVDLCAEQGIAYVAYFPLGGFSPLQSDALDRVAARLGVTPLQVSLAWLLRRPNVVAIPGASSVAQLESNAAAADLELSDDEDGELTAASDAFRPRTGASAVPDLVRARLPF